MSAGAWQEERERERERETIAGSLPLLLHCHFSFFVGQEIRIIVGQMGTGDGNNGYVRLCLSERALTIYMCRGGAGGTFVVDEKDEPVGVLKASCQKPGRHSTQFVTFFRSATDSKPLKANLCLF